MGPAFSPLWASPGCSYGRGGSLLATTVSEIHRYPLRPPGFEEPLFPTREFRRAVAEHLASAPWLSRGSELRRPSRPSPRGARARASAGRWTSVSGPELRKRALPHAQEAGSTGAGMLAGGGVLVG